MKNIFYMLLLVTTTAMAQRERTQVQGTIRANSESLSGITVFNNNSLEGTITNESGQFYINVRLGDKLTFKAVQFENFNLVVGDATLETKKIEITLKEGVNELDPVLVRNGSFMIPVKRTVFVDAQIDKVSDYNLKTPAIDRIENTFSDRIRQPEEYAVRNEAFMQTQPRFNMVNVVGALAGLLVGTALDQLNIGSGPKDPYGKKEFEVAILKNKYNTDYLIDFLKIERTDLYDFMYFAKDRGLNETYFTPEKELDLLQFLADTAEAYKERKKQ